MQLTDTQYKEMDRLDDLQDTLLALAAYDWYRFHDMRINRLKEEYGITVNNIAIYRYYMGNKDEYVEFNRSRFVKRHKEYLGVLINL